MAGEATVSGQASGNSKYFWLRTAHLIIYCPQIPPKAAQNVPKIEKIAKAIGKGLKGDRAGLTRGERQQHPNAPRYRDDIGSQAPDGTQPGVQTPDNNPPDPTNKPDTEAETFGEIMLEWLRNVPDAFGD